MLARQPQARLWNRTNSNFPKTQGPVARKKSQKATQILRAGNVLPTPRGNPRKWGPGPTPPVRGRWPEGPEGVGWATMSTKCSSGAVPGGVLGYLSRTPGEAQRSGFAGKRRSKEAVAVFAARRKRRQADFATTSRHGQSNSPPAGGETPLRTTNAVRNLPPHPSRLRRAAFPYPLCRFATSSLPLLAFGHFPLTGGIGPLTRGVGPRGEGFWGDLAP